MTVSAVSVHKLTKEFSTPFRRKRLVAVKELSLEVRAGEVYGLIGPNGSGKSTTLKIILGLIAPTSGSTAIFGRDSRKVDSRNQVGFLPENPYFYKHLSGEETLTFYGKLCGMGGKFLREKVDELFQLVDLEDARNRRLAGYSKGMLQRIGLAQALIQEPRLVLLDEPTAGVDPTGTYKIRDLILNLKEKGISVVLCSHLLEQVQQVCDRVGIIFNGKLVKEGALQELVEIEEQIEIVLENADSAIIEKIHSLVDKSSAKVVKVGRPKTTLERLFLQEIEE